MDFQETRQVEFLGMLRDVYAAEYDEFPTSAEPGEYHLKNGMFGSVDAELLYAMIRYVKPTQIVELFGGWSTLVALKAIEKNGVGTITTVMLNEAEGMAKRGVVVRRGDLRDHLDIFDILGPGNMLLVDSSHRFSKGNDVDLILQALDRLPRGVWIQFHDIFLPDGYPDAWADRGYDEQDHLATVIEAGDWEVVLAANYLHKHKTFTLGEAIGSYDPLRKIGPGSFWFMKPPEQAEPIEQPTYEAPVVPDDPHEFRSDRGGKKCLVCGKTARAKVHV